MASSGRPLWQRLCGEVKATLRTSSCTVLLDKAWQREREHPPRCAVGWPFISSSKSSRVFPQQACGVDGLGPVSLCSEPDFGDVAAPFLAEGERHKAVASSESQQCLPGLQLYRASYEKNLPQMAESLAHGADVNWVNVEESRSTPLIQAVLGVSSPLSSRVADWGGQPEGRLWTQGGAQG